MDSPPELCEGGGNIARENVNNKPKIKEKT